MRKTRTAERCSISRRILQFCRLVRVGIRSDFLRVAGPRKWRPRWDPEADLAKEIGRHPKAPAKFEQGGFTSRRRKDPKTLFPGASPGNLFGALSPGNSRRIEYRARRNIVVRAAHHQRDFVLARLQKPHAIAGRRNAASTRRTI